MLTKRITQRAHKLSQLTEKYFFKRVYKTMTGPQIKKKFDEEALFKAREQIHLVPYPDHVEDSEKYKIGILGGGI